jgi:hypothetical protein
MRRFVCDRLELRVERCEPALDLLQAQKVVVQDHLVRRVLEAAGLGRPNTTKSGLTMPSAVCHR